MEFPRREFLALSAAGAAGMTAGPAIIRSADAAPASSGAARTATHTVLLSGPDKDHPVDWDFLVTHGRNSNVWATLPVPSHWEFHGFGTYTTGWTIIPEELGRYRHSFTVPADWTGRRTYLVFEGAMTDTTVTVNGSSAGPTHQGGFYRFRYDVTELLRYGQPNLLEVTVSRDSTDASVNRAERQGDYWNFGGIYRPVYLQSYPAERIDRLAIDPRADGSITVDAYVGGITGPARLAARVLTRDGHPVSPWFEADVAAEADVVRLSATVAGIVAWSAEQPRLYRLDVRLSRDGRTLHNTAERFGFRTMEVRPGDGVYVNGRKIRLKGANRHTIWPDSGRAITPAIARRDIALMKQMNMNAVRMSHYPPDTYFLDLCDEMGLYVIDELAGWQKPYDAAHAVPLAKSLVIRDVNHPSVLFWANGNEGGWQTAADGEYARHDPQRRPVLHPWTTFSGVNTDHYETYAQTVADLQIGTVFMSTEMLHALYDGGAGAGLDDYWTLMSNAPRGAGGFIWALLDEGIRRDDRPDVIDVNPNYYPDGILGPYREKEASFSTIKDVWSPIQLTDRSAFEAAFPASFAGRIPITNHYDFTNARQCRFSWRLVSFPGPADGRSGHTVAARGDIAAPDVPPGGNGVLRLRLPAGWRRSDALTLIVRDEDGAELVSWTWMITSAAACAKRIVRPAPRPARTTSTTTASDISLRAAGTTVRIDRTTGRLTAVRAAGTTVSLTNGPAPATGTAVLRDIDTAPDGPAQKVTAHYTGGLDTVTWTLHPSGWLQLDYAYQLSGDHDFFGVTFDYPESKVTGITWLGNGPYRVYKNRTRGFPTDVWSKAHNDTATGADGWQYPEFKGYHGKTYWARLRTTEAPITVVAADEDLFLRLLTPRWGPNPQTAIVPFPAGDISFLDAIPAIGTKFDPATNLGPQSQPNRATGSYRRTLFFAFGA